MGLPETKVVGSVSRKTWWMVRSRTRKGRKLAEVPYEAKALRTPV